MRARTSRCGSTTFSKGPGQAVKDDREVAAARAVEIEYSGDQPSILGTVCVGPSGERLGDRRPGVDRVDEVRELTVERLLRLVSSVGEGLWQ